jgi:hypothetical protein
VFKINIQGQSPKAVLQCDVFTGFGVNHHKKPFQLKGSTASQEKGQSYGRAPPPEVYSEKILCFFTYFFFFLLPYTFPSVPSFFPDFLIGREW